MYHTDVLHIFQPSGPKKWGEKKKRIKILILKMTGKLKKNGITGKSEVKSWKVRSESERFSVMSDSLQPHGLIQSMEFCRPEYWSGSLFLLQGMFPNQESNQSLPDCRQILYQLSYQGSPPCSQKKLENKSKNSHDNNKLKRLN